MFPDGHAGIGDGYAGIRCIWKDTFGSICNEGCGAKNSVTVTWKKSKYATSYRIYYKQAGAKKWTTLATISSKNLKYTHKSSKKYPLKGGKKYSYTVRAYNKYGRKWSFYDTKGKTVTIPAVPSVVKASAKANSYKQVTVTWTKSINATNYVVYYRPSASADVKD